MLNYNRGCPITSSRMRRPAKPIMATRPSVFSRPGVKGPKLRSCGPSPAISLGMRVPMVVRATTAPKPRSEPASALSTSSWFSYRPATWLTTPWLVASSPAMANTKPIMAARPLMASFMLFKMELASASLLPAGGFCWDCMAATAWVARISCSAGERGPWGAWGSWGAAVWGACSGSWARTSTGRGTLSALWALLPRARADWRVENLFMSMVVEEETFETTTGSCCVYVWDYKM
mmetsp:Transcript_14648/g.39624  ORF Transcript_14648/g.39624 Transcript_14648/m.39624 type:complete len:234 (+) Transcript_14648:266-967(+)